MKARYISSLLPVLLPPLLMAQESAPVVEAPAQPEAPAAEAPAEPAPAAGTAPAQPAPSYECADPALEGKLVPLKQKAEAGDAEAAKQIYTAYALSGHTPQGLAWFGRYVETMQAKAEAGDVEAMYSLGMMFLRGEDYATPDIGQAVRWLHRAMEGGNPSAAFIMGDIFARQGNSAESASAYAKAYALYGEKAQQGDADALYWHGLMQVYGRGTQANPAGGIADLEKAAAAGNIPAIQQLFRIYVSGIGVEQDMERALQYACMAADQTQDGLMAFAAACMLIHGQGVPVDEARGDKYLDIAADKNIPAAIYLKATRLKAAGKDEEALLYFKQGASMGILPCMTEVGVCQLYGLCGEEQDEATAIAKLTRAADLWDTCQNEYDRSGSARAAYELALYYDSKDESGLADLWYVVASSRGVPATFARRGLMHINPFSEVSWSPSEAYRWWRNGKEAGDETCATYLNIFYFVFTPLVVTLAFGIPVYYVRRLQKKSLTPGGMLK